LDLSFSHTHAHSHTRTHAHSHTRTRTLAHTNTHTHTHSRTHAHLLQTRMQAYNNLSRRSKAIGNSARKAVITSTSNIIVVRFVCRLRGEHA